MLARWDTTVPPAHKKLSHANPGVPPRGVCLAPTCIPCSPMTVRPRTTNSIIKFADDTTMVGLITNGDETAYMEEVRDLATGVGFHTPIHINRATVERVKSFKFIGVHITEELTWSPHTSTVVKTARQCRFSLRKLKRVGRPLGTFTAAPSRAS